VVPRMTEHLVVLPRELIHLSSCTFCTPAGANTFRLRAQT
jgi:hypothetical protein